VDFKKFNEIAELVGIVAIVASLIFVGMQMKQTQSIALGEVLAANVGHRIESNNAIAQHSELWTKASAGEKLTRSEELIVSKLMDNLSAERLSLYQHFRELGHEVTAELILVEYALYLSENPGIYQRWLKTEQSYADARTTLVGEEYSLEFWADEMRNRVERLKAQAGDEQR